MDSFFGYIIGTIKFFGYIFIIYGMPSLILNLGDGLGLPRFISFIIVALYILVLLAYCIYSSEKEHKKDEGETDFNIIAKQVNQEYYKETLFQMAKHEGLFDSEEDSTQTPKSE